jgi:hypothetical protein
MNILANCAIGGDQSQGITVRGLPSTPCLSPTCSTPPPPATTWTAWRRSTWITPP